MLIRNWLNYKGPKHQSEVPTVGSGGGGVPELDPCSFSTSTWPLPLSSTGILMSPYPPPMQKENSKKNITWKKYTTISLTSDITCWKKEKNITYLWGAMARYRRWGWHNRVKLKIGLVLPLHFLWKTNNQILEHTEELELLKDWNYWKTIITEVIDLLKELQLLNSLKLLMN